MSENLGQRFIEPQVRVTRQFSCLDKPFDFQGIICKSFATVRDRIKAGSVRAETQKSALLFQLLTDLYFPFFLLLGILD